METIYNLVGIFVVVNGLMFLLYNPVSRLLKSDFVAYLRGKTIPSYILRRYYAEYSHLPKLKKWILKYRLRNIKREYKYFRINSRI